MKRGQFPLPGYFLAMDLAFGLSTFLMVPVVFPEAIAGQQPVLACSAFMEGQHEALLCSVHSPVFWGQAPALALQSSPPA